MAVDGWSRQRPGAELQYTMCGRGRRRVAETEAARGTDPPAARPTTGRQTAAPHGSDRGATRDTARAATVRPCYTSVASIVMSAFSTLETGQPSLAAFASSSNFALSMPGTRARSVR